NWMTGEEVTYQFDELERLIAAQTTSSAWGLSWSYDGFGNRLSQTVTKGAGPQSVQIVNPQNNRIQMSRGRWFARGCLPRPVVGCRARDGAGDRASWVRFAARLPRY
ncbi:MAG: hypothetical protein ACK532_08070, partial [Acidobacteriota bacterium]